MKLKVLMVGDVVGSPGRRMLREHLKALRENLGLAGIVVNGENAAAGNGITTPLADEISSFGADAITLGDHTWGQKDFSAGVSRLSNCIRPANFPPGAPGKGWCIVTTPLTRFAVVNLIGRIFMQPAECPFLAADRILAEIPRDLPVFVDFHAEATSEKISLAQYLDGRVTAVVGTHTHVQTSDAFVFPGGTAFQSDLGMTGPWFSSIGRAFKPVLQKFLTGVPARFDVADGPATLEGAVIEFDPATRRAVSIEPLRIRENMDTEKPQ